MFICKNFAYHISGWLPYRVAFCFWMLLTFSVAPSTPLTMLLTNMSHNILNRRFCDTMNRACPELSYCWLVSGEWVVDWLVSLLKECFY